MSRSREQDPPPPTTLPNQDLVQIFTPGEADFGEREEVLEAVTGFMYYIRRSKEVDGLYIISGQNSLGKERIHVVAGRSCDPRAPRISLWDTSMDELEEILDSEDEKSVFSRRGSSDERPKNLNDAYRAFDKKMKEVGVETGFYYIDQRGGCCAAHRVRDLVENNIPFLWSAPDYQRVWAFREGVAEAGEQPSHEARELIGETYTLHGLADLRTYTPEMVEKVALAANIERGLPLTDREYLHGALDIVSGLLLQPGMLTEEEERAVHESLSRVE